MLWPSPLRTFLHQFGTPSWVRFLVAFAPTVLWATMIFWFSSRSDLPTLEQPAMEWFWKKLAHGLVYGGLYFWLWWGRLLVKSKPIFQLTYQEKIQLLCLIFLYAASDEFHQSFTATRHPSVIDIGIDLLGASTSSVILHRYFAPRR